MYSAMPARTEDHNQFSEICECCELSKMRKFQFCCCSLCMWVATMEQILKWVNNRQKEKDEREDPCCVTIVMACVGVTSIGCLGLPAAYPCGMCLAAAVTRQKLANDNEQMCIEDCCETCFCPPCKLAQLYRIAHDLVPPPLPTKKTDGPFAGLLTSKMDSTLGPPKNKGAHFADLLVSKMDL